MIGHLLLFLPLLLLPFIATERICPPVPFNDVLPAQLRIVVPHVPQTNVGGSKKRHSIEGQRAGAVGKYEGLAKLQEGRTGGAARGGVTPPTTRKTGPRVASFKPLPLFLSIPSLAPHHFASSFYGMRPSLSLASAYLVPLCPCPGGRASVRLDRTGDATGNWRSFTSLLFSSKGVSAQRGGGSAGGTYGGGGDGIETVAEEADYSKVNVIAITDAALDRIKVLCMDPARLSADGLLYLRMGVKSGGCSGLSYSLDGIQQVTHGRGCW
eukprot:GHVS01071423.1.p1 GENE.GHVS01071423.1~~GHVS01071423.1.p1  ORF type:complete len:268 (-),score=35.94 GHVS01071423.1:465-1268(-)